MGETTDQIELYIQHRRADLEANLHQLEDRVKSAADWRHQYRKKPLAFLGSAFAAGILLAFTIGRRTAGPARVIVCRQA